MKWSEATCGWRLGDIRMFELSPELIVGLRANRGDQVG